jgi:hypothetical protein
VPVADGLTKVAGAGGLPGDGGPGGAGRWPVPGVGGRCDRAVRAAGAGNAVACEKAAREKWRATT